MKLNITNGISLCIDLDKLDDDVLDVFIQAFTSESNVTMNESVMLQLKHVYISLDCFDDINIREIINDLCFEKLKRSYVRKELLLRGENTITSNELKEEYMRIHKSSELIENNVESECKITNNQVNQYENTYTDLQDQPVIFNNEDQELKNEIIDIIKKCENYVKTGIYDIV